MQTIKQYHGVTALGMQDYDDMVLTLKIANTWVDTPIRKDVNGLYYIRLNDVKIFVDDLYNE